jgi:hypothetical protein
MMRGMIEGCGGKVLLTFLHSSKLMGVVLRCVWLVWQLRVV